MLYGDILVIKMVKQTQWGGDLAVRTKTGFLEFLRNSLQQVSIIHKGKDYTLTLRI